MRLVDANVLIYAVDADARHHAASTAWLNAALSGGDRVGISWVVLLAFLRLSTSTVLPRPISTGDATDLVEAWLSQPAAVVLRPGPDHLVVLRRLLRTAGTAGNLVNDGHLAALALENKAEVVSYDRDLDRFREVRRREPDELLAGGAAP